MGWKGKNDNCDLRIGDSAGGKESTLRSLQGNPLSVWCGMHVCVNKRQEAELEVEELKILQFLLRVMGARNQYKGTTQV